MTRRVDTRRLAALALGAATLLFQASALAQTASDAGAPIAASADAGVAVQPSGLDAGVAAPLAQDAGPPPIVIEPKKETVPVKEPVPVTQPTPPPVKKEEPKKEEKDDSDSTPLWTGTNRFADRYYELGVTAGSGGGLLFATNVESVGLTGIRVFEHHGYISKVLVAALVAMGQSDKKYMGSSYSNHYTAYGTYTVRTDYYRSLTPEERAAQQKAVADAAKGQYTTELTVYTPKFLGLDPGRTAGSGFEASLGGDIVLGFVGDYPAILTIGGYGAYMTAPAIPKGPASAPAAGQPAVATGPTNLTYAAIGAMLRTHIPITKFAEFTAEWDLNLLSLFFTSAEDREKSGDLYQSPLKLGAYVHATDRAYVQGRVIMGGFGFSDGKLGAQAELGIRF